MGAQALRSMPYSVPLRVSRSGGEKGNRRARLEGVQRAPHRHGVEGQGQGGKQALPLPEGQVVQLAQGGGEVGPGLLGQLLQPLGVGGVQRHRQGGVKQPLPSPLHLVPQTGHVLQGDLRLGRQASAPV